ncbi:MAG: AAA family ATPase [Brevinematia bacterium]
MKIEINEDFKLALKLIQEGKNIFITGKAGTGKSTFLRYFIENSDIPFVILAPTGVAALNIGGQTIHSFFKILPHESLSDINGILKRHSRESIEMLKEVELIIIDEVSMLRADLFDLMDVILRKLLKKKKNFAGKQLLLVGDLYQLPPVINSREKKAYLEIYNSPYFFSAECYDELNIKIVEFEKIYRQKDIEFINILNRIRNGTVTEEDINFINRKCSKNPPQNKELFVYLTPYNETARKTNEEKLHELKGKEYIFKGEIDGEFNIDFLPTDEVLRLKKNAQVMMLTNNWDGGWVNGTIGKILEFEDEETILVETDEGKIIRVMPFEWDIFDYEYDRTKDRINKRKIGSFRQFPLRLAWSITIHKSQGKTFNNVVLDIGRGAFSPGQTYVALSRCTSLDGLYLVKPLSLKHVFIDRKIIKFMTESRYKESELETPLEKKIEIIREAIASKSKMEIVYLKKSDEKSRRVILPLYLGKMQYSGKEFFGLTAFCFERNEERNFRLERILEMKKLDE